jgi:hypothetical protein
MEKMFRLKSLQGQLHSHFDAKAWPATDCTFKMVQGTVKLSIKFQWFLLMLLYCIYVTDT